jgi:hypothetical protein
MKVAIKSYIETRMPELKYKEANPLAAVTIPFEA